MIAASRPTLRPFFPLLLLAAVALAACAPQPPAQPPPPAEPPDTRAADEAAIRAAVVEWSAAAQAKDPVKFAAFYAEDATVMLAGTSDLSGINQIREGLTGMMKDPNFSLSFSPDKVVVARAGDFAYETGTYTMSMSDPKKKPVVEQGRYVTVWRKQPDGSWKVVVDAPVSDPAQPPAQP